MSNSSVGILGAASTAVISVPVTFIASGGSLNIGNKGFVNLANVDWYGNDVSLVKLSDVKKSYKNIDCLKDFEGGNTWEDSNPTIFLTSNPENKETQKGCLMVEYYKQTETSTKWWGGFRLIWSVSSGKQGLVTVVNVDTKKGKLILDSSIYIIQTNNNIWSLSRQVENVKQEISNTSDLSKYFPQPNSEMKTSDYWGFFPDMEKICSDHEYCGIVKKDETAIKQTLRWNWTRSEEGNPITNWNKDFNSWFDSLFDSNWGTVKNSLKDIKGIWSKKEVQN